jgi:hypothetical protein
MTALFSDVACMVMNNYGKLRAYRGASAAPGADPLVYDKHGNYNPSYRSGITITVIWQNRIRPDKKARSAAKSYFNLRWYYLRKLLFLY